MSDLLREFFLAGRRRCMQNMKFEHQNIIITESENALWYPVRTMPQHEMKLHSYLKKNGIPAYLPVVPDIKIHNVYYNDSSYRYESDILRPMLKSYIFAQMSDEQKRNIWRSNSVQTILNVGREQQASFIEELRGLQVMEELALHAKLEYKREIKVNDQFIIESPSQFEGTLGYLVEKRKRFLWIIKLEILGGFISAEIDPRRYKFSKI